MTIHFALTDDERSFLRHWSYESMCLFAGPALIWCRNHQVSFAYGPYPMAELYWAEEIEAGGEWWIFERPPIPFRIPWRDAEEFWLRANAALALIPRLQGDSRFTPSDGIWQVEGILTPEESNYLRAYNQEMVLSGTGHYIDLAHQHGALSHHLIPFFILLDDLYRLPTTPVVYPLVELPRPIRGTVRPQVRLPRVGLGPQVDIGVVDRTEEFQRSLMGNHDGSGRSATPHIT